ncbi:MAG: hypothetical protein PF487_09040 [Bacteroidales bacterium]|jgi:hypothetical protein|nr:hypothetical protein [Bacteroidales bacterium]
MNKFSLTHVALYSKHWYNHSNNIIEDLSKCINADGFYISPVSGEIFNIIFNKLINAEVLDMKTNLISLINDASPKNSWKNAYYTKDSICNPNPKIEYDYYTALIYSCIYYIQNLEKDQWDFTVNPDPKVLPVSKEKIQAYEILLIKS